MYMYAIVYRPITMFSVRGKVFAHVILARIRPSLDSAKRPQQSEFTTNRSTIDAILALLSCLNCTGSLAVYVLDVAFLDTMFTHPGIEIGLNSFTDLDTALFLPHDQDFTEILSTRLQFDPGSRASVTPVVAISSLACW